MPCPLGVSGLQTVAKSVLDTFYACPTRVQACRARVRVWNGYVRPREVSVLPTVSYTKLLQYFLITQYSQKA